MGIKPMVAALWRNPVGPGLVAFEIAITLAVIVNAFYFMAERIDKLNQPVGMDVENIFWMTSEGYAPDFNYGVSVRADLALLNATPGVLAATTINRIPLSGRGATRTYSPQPGQKGGIDSASMYLVTEHGVGALGVTLSEGRPFAADVITRPALDHMEALASAGPEIILTRAMASKLFPDGKALGQFVYGGDDRALRVTGVIEDMQGIDPAMPTSAQVVLLPAIAPGPSVSYLIRAAPGRLNELMGALPDKLAASQSGRAITQVEALSATAKRTYTLDRSPNIFVGIITLLVSVVASLGIFGQAMFSVTTRTRQIGVRRALGGRKLDILKYFLLENWLVTTAGVAAGCLLALAIGVQLSLLAQSPRLPLYYLVVGVAVAWVLGLCATFIPARRAAAVSPAVATRTV
jgi:putative ABC transport system permease protein